MLLCEGSWLSQWFPFSVAVRMVLAMATSFFCTLFLGRRLIQWLRQMRAVQPIRSFSGFTLAELHKSKSETPTMGGVLILASVVFSVLLWANIKNFFLLLVMSSFVSFGVMGMIDDWAKLKKKSWRGVPGIVRFAFQTVWGVMLVVLLSSPAWISWCEGPIPSIMRGEKSLSWEQWQASIFVPFFREPLFIVHGIVGWSCVYSIQWFALVGTANAINLTDGLDGLASGMSFLVTVVLGAVSYIIAHPLLELMPHFVAIPSMGEVSVCLAALAGALIGFLWFNVYPAQVFMGDTGSLAIGGMIGSSAVVLKQEWLLALVGIVFVFETLSVIVQVISFRYFGTRLFRCTPLHHHFEYKGMPETRIVMRFWIVGIIFAVLGGISLVW